MSSVTVASNNCDLTDVTGSSPNSNNNHSNCNNGPSAAALSPTSSISNLLPSSPSGISSSAASNNFWPLSRQQQQQQQQCDVMMHSTPISNSGRVVSKVIGPLPASAPSPLTSAPSWPSSGQQSSTSSTSSSSATEQDVNPLDNWVYTTAGGTPQSNSLLNNSVNANTSQDSGTNSFSKSWNAADMSLMNKLIGNNNVIGSKLNDSGFIDHPAAPTQSSAPNEAGSNNSRIFSPTLAGNASNVSGLNINALYNELVRCPSSMIQQQQQSSGSKPQQQQDVNDLFGAMSLESDLNDLVAAKQSFSYQKQQNASAAVPPPPKMPPPSSKPPSEHQESSDPAFLTLASRLFSLESNNSSSNNNNNNTDGVHRCGSDGDIGRLNANNNQQAPDLSAEQAFLHPKFNAVVGSNIGAAQQQRQQQQQRMIPPSLSNLPASLTPMQYLYLQKLLASGGYSSSSSPGGQNFGQLGGGCGQNNNANNFMAAVAAANKSSPSNAMFHAGHSSMAGQQSSPSSSSSWMSGIPSSASPLGRTPGGNRRPPAIPPQLAQLAADAKQAQMVAAAMLNSQANRPSGATSNAASLYASLPPALAAAASNFNNRMRSNSPVSPEELYYLRGAVAAAMQQQQQQQNMCHIEGRSAGMSRDQSSPLSQMMSSPLASSQQTAANMLNQHQQQTQHDHNQLASWLAGNSVSGNSNRFLIGSGIQSSNNSGSCSLGDHPHSGTSSSQHPQPTLPATDDPLVKKQICEVRANEHKSKARFSETFPTPGGHSPHFVRWVGRRQEPVNMQGGVSSKVFLGGLPWDINEEELLETFASFGAVSIEWPNKDHVEKAHGKGYAYAVFADSKSVVSLLNRCQKERAKDNENICEFFFGFSRRHSKTMQIIPWFTADNEWAVDPSLLSTATSSSSSTSSSPPPAGSNASSTGTTSPAANPVGTRLTAFVGALHGQMTAMMLRIIFEEKFGKVLSVYLDTDKHKYPIGSGRVVFAETKAFRQAIEAGFVDVQTQHIFKRIQIDPYLEEQACWMCNGARPGDYFCRSFDCFRYFCPECFYDFHASIELNRNSVVTGHVPIARSTASTRSNSNGSSNSTVSQVPSTSRSVSSSSASGSMSPNASSNSGTSSPLQHAAAAAVNLLNSHRHYLVQMVGAGSSSSQTPLGSSPSPNNSANSSSGFGLPAEWSLNEGR